MSPAHYPFGLGEIVSARAARAVRGFLAAFDDDQWTIGKMPRLIADLEKVKDEVVSAMSAELGAEKVQHRILASYVLLGSEQRRRGLVTQTAFEQAEAIMLDALRAKEKESYLPATMLLSGGGVTERIAIVLQEFLKEESYPWRAAFAAVGLLRERNGRMPNPEAERVLNAALYGHDEVLAGVAGAALLQVKSASASVRRAVIERLPLLGENGQYQMLISFKHHGGVTDDFFNVLAKLLKDRSVNRAVRKESAVLLGRISRENGRALPLLLQCLHDKLWQVVKGAVQGLKESQRVPDGASSREAVVHLTSLLSHEEAEMRCSAAYGIPLMGEAAKEAIPALIAHLPEERNLDVCQVIATTLGDLGEAAIPALVRAIKEGQAPNAEALVMGLAQMGEKAVVAIAELLPQTEGRVCDMLVGVLMMLGPQAKPAVGVLTRMLDQTERQELAVTVAMAIFMCGRCAGEAIPALIRCVAVREPDDQAVPWAERSLWCMREQSLQAVRFAIENTDGEIKTRLERVLTGMEAPIMDGFSRLDKLQCDGLIELFVAIGELLENSDTRLNWADIAKAIAGKVIREEFEYPQTGLGQRNLQNKMAELGAKLKECKGKIVVLTAQGRNHPCTLTPDGKEFLREGQEYLRMKSSLRRQGRNGH